MSSIPQFVSNGYISDHAFALVRGRAARLRDKLFDQGARFIVCFLDENSVNDKRWGVSHAFRAENYDFLLHRLLDDPTLGLVIKPKKPADLRRRLGPVSELLDAALATGRCHLYDDGIVATPALPCEASLAADITIALLFGSTAALESALTGTPTVLIDRESLPYHPLYALGEGSVVFRDWEGLWGALATYRRAPGAQPGFGDWSPTLSTLDSFQDGKAAERMGQYIHCLAEGLAAGLTRDEAMESARNWYVSLWGEDKVVDIRIEPMEAGRVIDEVLSHR